MLLCCAQWYVMRMWCNFQSEDISYALIYIVIRFPFNVQFGIRYMHAILQYHTSVIIISCKQRNCTGSCKSFYYKAMHQCRIKRRLPCDVRHCNVSDTYTLFIYTKLYLNPVSNFKIDFYFYFLLLPVDI